MGSVFTKIINGEIPSYKLYEDEKTLVFLDNAPTTPGHALVVPKVEIDKIYELPNDYYFAVMATAKKVSQHMEKVLGTRTLWKVIGTDVPHAHLHLIPYDPTWSHQRKVEQTPEDLEKMRQKLTMIEK